MELNKDFILSIEKDISKNLSTKRYYHSLAVAGMASGIAMKYNINTKKAYVAGLLHDYAKEYDSELILDIANKNNIQLSLVEQKSPTIIHGKISAIKAKEIFNIEDEDLLNSLRYHTSGRLGMSDLEKIIFLADYLEPHRKDFEGINIIKNEIYNNLDYAMYFAQCDLLEHLKAKNKPILESTPDVINYYKSIYKKENA